MNCTKYLEALPYLHLHADPLTFGYTLARLLSFAGRLYAASINELKEYNRMFSMGSSLRCHGIVPRCTMNSVSRVSVGPQNTYMIFDSNQISA